MLCKGYVSKHGYAYDVLEVEVALLETLLADLLFILVPQQERLRFIVIQVVDLPVGAAHKRGDKAENRVKSRNGVTWAQTWDFLCSSSFPKADFAADEPPAPISARERRCEALTRLTRDKWLQPLCCSRGEPRGVWLLAQICPDAWPRAGR